MSDLTSQKRSAILEELRSIILGLTKDGVARLASHNVTILNLSQKEYNHHCFDQPLAALTVRGRKLIQSGPHELETGPGTALVTCVDMPSHSVVLDVSPENPYLAIVIKLDCKILADILAELPESHEPRKEQGDSIWLMDADITFIDAFLRLARLMSAPRHIHILLPLLLREIHYLILISPRGGLLHQLYTHGGRNSRIIDVIAWMKQNIASPVAMETLARMANMSISSFHRHFKSITGFSPLQYHKKLRLHEAQRLMLSENRRITDVAAEVGYESITQFTREYRRLFGEPPGRDVNRLKKKFEG